MSDVPVTSGDSVFFAVGDVVCPDLTGWFEHVGPDLLLSGEVVFLSDQGRKRNEFAIVDVGGIHHPLIVPTVRLRQGVFPSSEHAPAARQ